MNDGQRGGKGRTRGRIALMGIVSMVVGGVLVAAQSTPQPETYRPTVRGRRGIVAGGHPLVAEAGLRLLHRGGNAVDAGVAAVLAASVVEISHFGFGGEVPVLIRMAGQPVVAINGQGQAPELATPEFYRQLDPPRIPSTGPLAATVPGVLDAMVVALQRYGTKSLAEVLEPAIELADGFPIDEMRVAYLTNTRRVYEVWPASREVFLPGGEVPRVGDLFVQKNLAATLRELVAVEKRQLAKRQTRVRALEAVRDHFYQGPLGARFCAAIEAAGGLLRPADLARFRAEVETPERTTYRGYDVYKVGFWSQGPVMLEALNLLEGYDLKAMGHNSPEYVHTTIEALKLAFADRDRYFGDPRFGEVPGAALLSKEYAAMRRGLIDPRRASLEQRPGDPLGRRPLGERSGEAETGPSRVPLDERANDTTCVNVIDAAGNVFSATPSGAWLPAFLAGETGIPVSNRLQSFLLEAGHPNELRPGKRPRITLTPTIVLRGGEPFAALSTPGGDNQDQALLQVFFNLIEFGMNPQQAVEAGRFETQHYVSSFDDHRFSPGSLILEQRLGGPVIEDLRQRGHRVEVKEDYSPSAAPTVILYDPKTRVIQAGADVRRGRYAMGY